MELVRGESLSGLLRREVRLPAERTLEILRESAAGLGAAHAAGVVHRDVKPGNVLLGADGTVKITDFGVAVSAASVSLTQTGEAIGTPHYLSPEQAQGVRATPASDVYALGVVGYQCLSGRRVFDAESPVQVALMQIRDTPAPLPSDVPPAVRELIETALHKDPAERFPDGAAFRDAIDDVLAGHPLRPTITATPTTVLPVAAPVRDTVALSALTPGPEPADDGRRRLLVPLIALLAVAGIVTGGLQLMGDTSDDGGTATAPTTAPSSSAPAAPTVRLVDLTSSDYVGRPVSEVQAQLTARGLIATIKPQQTSDTAAGLVTAVDPAGALPPNSQVTVTYAVAPPPPTPTPTPTPTPVLQPPPKPTQVTSNAGKGNNGKDNKGRGKGHGDG